MRARTADAIGGQNNSESEKYREQSGQSEICNVILEALTVRNCIILLNWYRIKPQTLKASERADTVMRKLHMTTVNGMRWYGFKAKVVAEC